FQIKANDFYVVGAVNPALGEELLGPKTKTAEREPEDQSHAQNHDDQKYKRDDESVTVFAAVAMRGLVPGYVSIVIHRGQQGLRFAFANISAYRRQQRTTAPEIKWSSGQSCR